MVFLKNSTKTPIQGKQNPMDISKILLQQENPIVKPTVSSKPRELEHDKFHMIQNFLLYIDPNFKESVERTPEMSKARQKELDNTLQTNLNHQNIGSIHIMFTDKKLPSHIDDLNLKNREKLILKHFDTIPTISMFLQYMEENLQKKLVIVTNQDIEYGEGWDKIDLQKFRDQKLMYALTRNVKEKHVKSPNCYGGKVANCNPGGREYGSFDLFAFYVNGKVPKEMVDEMTYTQAEYGMENVFIWYAINKWGYNVMNPCKVLMAYHIDCYHIDRKGRKRQKSNHIASVRFTDKLYMN